MVKRKMLRISTKKKFGFIMTDHKGRVLRKGGAYKELIKKNKRK
jgi:F420-0:gamma-glutamyl ligase